MKVHLVNLTGMINAPSWLRQEMREEKTEPTKCGYLRKKTTVRKHEVTCKLCLREMNK